MSGLSCPSEGWPELVKDQSLGGRVLPVPQWVSMGMLLSLTDFSSTLGFRDASLLLRNFSWLCTAGQRQIKVKVFHDLASS